uniref:Alternative protein KIAA0556 n=1 Tax=Homo sapiens TaxID=9606 RepID=L8ECF8_HUMAN|nr:alternative protein KIAA0556 [Homo sapiens]
MSMTLLRKTYSLSLSQRTRHWWAIPDMTALLPVATGLRKMFTGNRRQKDALLQAQTPSWCWNLTQLPKVIKGKGICLQSGRTMLRFSFPPNLSQT